MNPLRKLINDDETYMKRLENLIAFQNAVIISQHRWMLHLFCGGLCGWVLFLVAWLG